MKRPQSKNEQLDNLYAELPTIDCQGLCHTSCGPIDMSDAERRRIADAGTRIPARSFIHDGWLDCPALTMFKQCAVYEIRPMICRIWGLTKILPCTYGCTPDRYLTEPEAYELLARAHEISGQHDDARVFRTAALPQHQALLKGVRDSLDLQAEALMRGLRQ